MADGLWLASEMEQGDGGRGRRWCWDGGGMGVREEVPGGWVGEQGKGVSPDEVLVVRRE
jgi:hypothetical protein